MAKKKKQPIPPQKKPFPWQILLAVGVLVAGVAVYVMMETPSSEELDLSIIEQGGNVVGQIHDPD